LLQTQAALFANASALSLRIERIDIGLSHHSFPPHVPLILAWGYSGLVPSKLVIPSD
jgi:hypothetical protein